MDILVFEKSYTRIAQALAKRMPSVRAIAWSTNNGLTINGQSIDEKDIAPAAGWISGDILAAGAMKEYANVLQRFDTMRWVQSANAGLDHEIYPALAQRNIRLCKSGAQSIPIAEYVLGYALEYFQDFAFRRDAQTRKEWKPHRFRELWHSTWLIIGYGHIGRGVVVRAKSFDCKTIVVRRLQVPDPLTDEVATLEQLPELLPRADVVVLACPVTEHTQSLADDAFFAKLKKDALLINIARGGLLKEDALLEGLKRNQPGRAVLDVFETEPLPSESPLWTHPQVTISAHISNAGSGTRERGDELFLSNLERFMAEKTLHDEVDPRDL